MENSQEDIFADYQIARKEKDLVQPHLDLEYFRNSCAVHSRESQRVFDEYHRKLDPRYKQMIFQHGGVLGMWDQGSKEGLELGPLELSSSTPDVPESFFREEGIHLPDRPVSLKEVFFSQERFLREIWRSKFSSASEDFGKTPLQEM